MNFTATPLRGGRRIQVGPGCVCHCVPSEGWRVVVFNQMNKPQLTEQQKLKRLQQGFVMAKGFMTQLGIETISTLDAAWLAANDYIQPHQQGRYLQGFVATQKLKDI